MTVLTIVSAPAFTAFHTLPVHVPTSENMALTVLTIVSAPALTAFHTSPAKDFAASKPALTVLTIVSAPALTAFHTSPAKDFAASKPALTVLAISSAPALTAFHTSPAKDFAASKPALTVLAMVAPVFCRKSHTSLAHSPTFLASETTISIAVSPASLIAFQIGVKILSTTHWPTSLSALMIPWKMPRTIFSPGSSIVEAGEAMPNAFLKPSINGSNICVFIHVPTFLIAFSIPLKTPATTSPPAASMESLK